MISPEVRAMLDARNLAMETEFTWRCGEQDLCDLGAGYVPNTIKALARSLLNYHDEELRKMDARASEQQRTRKPRRKGGRK